MQLNTTPNPCELTRLDYLQHGFNVIISHINKEIKRLWQMAHDVRSPLATLEILSKRLPEIDEAKRQLLYETICHIRNIVNHFEENTSPPMNDQSTETTPLALLMNDVVAERRMAFSNHLIKITCDLEPPCYGYFTKASTTKLKRVLTNVINNACEAVVANSGEVQITIIPENNHALIKISDNGGGFTPEAYKALFTQGFTTKNKGSGLGLYHAKQNIEKWNGQIEIISNQGEGVIAVIRLPLHPPPSWFIDSITLAKNATVICIDDHPLSFRIWQQRLKESNTDIRLHYCSNKEEVLSLTKLLDQTPCIYFIEHEYAGQYYTGIDVCAYIRSLGVKNNKVYIVTHRVADAQVQHLCAINNIQIIPKEFVEKISLIIEKNTVNNKTY